jgi:hypothetical protein
MSSARSNWKAFTVYTSDGDLAIDDNAAEDALRGVVIGRKNRLFLGSDKGGRIAALLASFIALADAWDRSIRIPAGCAHANQHHARQPTRRVPARPLGGRWYCPEVMPRRTGL